METDSLPPCGFCPRTTGDAKNKNGKLRLLYECAPMSFIAEQVGGVAAEVVVDVVASFDAAGRGARKAPVYMR